VLTMTTFNFNDDATRHFIINYLSYRMRLVAV
jgi:hypothetical protein